MRSTPTVLVLGLGGMGSAAAWQLARRGVRVIGFDRFGPAHDRGSSHGRTRVIRQAYFEHPSYVPLLRRAYELWDEASRESGQALLTLCGGLMMGPPGSEVVQGSLRSAREHGLPHEMLDAAGIRERYPAFSVEEGCVGLFEQRAGVVHTEKAVATHLDLAEVHGAELRFGEPVTGWECTPGGGVRVRTPNGEWEGDRLVLTPGPWAPGVLESLGVPLVVERQVLFWFQPTGGVRPYLPGRFPIFICERADGLQPYGFPAMDGPRGGVKVALFRLPDRQECTPETVDRMVHPADEALMRRAVRPVLPGLDGPLIHATTCMYTNTPDQHFLIGLHPEWGQVALAAGFSGHGFKFCSVVGEILAELALEGRSRHDLGLFRLDRFS